MKKVTIVKDVKQASKEDLMALLAFVNTILVYRDNEIMFNFLMKKAPIAIRVILEENNGDIWALRNLSSEIITMQIKKPLR